MAAQSSLAQLLQPRGNRPGRLFLADVEDRLARSAAVPSRDEPAANVLGEPPNAGNLPASDQADAPAGRRPPSIKARLPRPIRIGHVQRKGKLAPFAWKVGEQSNAFLLAIGSSGSGKTGLLRVIGAGLTRQALPVLALDFHGDLAIPGLPRHRIGAQLGVNPLALGNLGATETSPRVVLAQLLRQAVPEIGHVQQALLRDALEAVAARRGRAAMLQDLHEELKARAASSGDRAPARGLQAALDELFADRVFNASQTISLPKLLHEGATLDLSTLSRPARVVAAGAVLAQLFEILSAAGPVPDRGMLRCFVLIDEAALLRESVLVDSLVREARKFGLGMAVATQELRDLSPSLQANAASAAIFLLQGRAESVQAARLVRGVNPDDLQRLAAPGECYFRDSEGAQRVRVDPPPEPEE